MNGGEVVFHFKGNTDDVDKKTNNLAKDITSKLGSAGKTIGTAFLKGTAVATGALAGFVGASVKGFSEMEQLSGGAKKIFDEMDYSEIKKDAVNAYNQMNMSAQEYLTAITMGDKKGYDTAKKGLQAISDYATGTGADINLLTEKYKMITRSTSSYLSIADQFSGLLPQTTDGFLKQAQASGYLSSEYKKLTDVPVDEYQQAITNMLEKGVKNMGLLGNTSAEAVKTISGSFLATKSALSNFISGVGGVDEVVSSITNLGTNIVNAIKTMGPKIVTGLVEITKGLMPQIPILINSLLPTLITGAVGLMNSLVQQAPTIINTLMGLLPTLVSAIADMLPVLTKASITGFILIIQALAQQAPVLISQIVDAILEIIPILIDNLPLFLKAGAQLLGGLIAGLVNSIPVLLLRCSQIGISLVNAFRKIDLIDIGKNLLMGLVNGIRNAKNWVINKIKGICNEILGAIKNFFGVHSPSVKFAWIGKMNMVGLQEGMENMQPDLQKTINGMFDLSPNIYGSASTHFSPNVNVVVNNNMKQDPLGQMVNDIKTFSGGSKNDYNYVGA